MIRWKGKDNVMTQDDSGDWVLFCDVFKEFQKLRDILKQRANLAYYNSTKDQTAFGEQKGLIEAVILIDNILQTWDVGSRGLKLMAAFVDEHTVYIENLEKDLKESREKNAELQKRLDNFRSDFG